MLRHIYSVLFYLLLPVLFLRLLWRSRRQPAYRARWRERLGYYPFKLEKVIWVHAVSLGETLAAIPLIKALKAQYPQKTILVTTTTPTGAERVQVAFGDSVKHVYLPYDFLGGVQRFLKAMQPLLGIIIETELWPNLFYACRSQQVPLCLLNGRLSAKSAAGYERIAPLTREILAALSVIAAQGQADAERFIALGMPANKVVFTGNIKFDIVVPNEIIHKSKTLRLSLGGSRPIWIAASTHEGEEEIVLQAHKIVRQALPNALLILVPRHSDRFTDVAKLCEQHGFNTVRRSTNHMVSLATEIYLGDTLGELLLLYAVADVTFVGGSLIPRGGHNVLEPAVLKKPILTGPHLFNFAEISNMLFTAGALGKIQDATTLATQLLALLRDPTLCQEMGSKAEQVVAANRGALDRQLTLVHKLISSLISAK